MRRTRVCPTCGEHLYTCRYCGKETVEVYSSVASDMYGNGWRTIHHTTHRAGDTAPLGAVECGSGQFRWGA